MCQQLSLLLLASNTFVLITLRIYLFILLWLYLLFIFFVITFKLCEKGQTKAFYKDIPPVRSNFLRVLMDWCRNNAAAKV